LVDPGEALDGDGLAGAVVADERRHLPGREIEVHVGESLDGPEALVEASHLEKRLARVSQRCFHVSLGHHASLFFPAQ
jgi:hypothetical protein